MSQSSVKLEYPRKRPKRPKLCGWRDCPKKQEVSVYGYGENFCLHHARVLERVP